MIMGPFSGLNWILGGLAAALLVPVLSIGLNVPFFLSCAVAALACGGLVVILAPRRPFEGLEGAGIARSRIEFARELLADAEPLVARMERSAKVIRTTAVSARVHHLASVARGILAGIEKDPLKVDRVRRFITYYLPRATELSEAYGLLEQQVAPRPERLKSSSELIDRLDLAFTLYSDSLVDADLDKLDVELKLLKASLDDDLGPVTPGISQPDAVTKRIP
jgi:5-bromo-4-chloroindolyl phosphate hydrolysis protein